MNNLHVLHRGLGIILLAAFVSLLSASAMAVPPDMTIGAEQYPDADAIILRWEQTWTIDADGAVHRRDHKWLKLLDRRAIRANADPRIDYHKDTDEVIIHAAQTHLPDGTVMPVPDYSFNLAAPNDVAGWPAWAGWEQTVVSFSGIVNDCVLELDYEVVTEPGVVPWISADLRLHQAYPTVERIVRVKLATGVALQHRVDGPVATTKPQRKRVSGGGVEYLWQFENLPGMPDEPQALPWQERCGRLRLTTCPDAKTWANTLIDAVDAAGQPDARVAEFARKAVEDTTDLHSGLKALAKAMHDSFNYVHAAKTMRGVTCRDAAAVYNTNYGSTLESAALLLAACRSLGVEAEPSVAVDTRFWNLGTPVDQALDSIVLRIKSDDGVLLVHPELGLIENPGNWGYRTLLAKGSGGSLSEIQVLARGEGERSKLDVTGRIELAADGTAAGEIRLSLTGAFYNPSDLESASAQRALVNRFLGRVITGMTVDDCSVTALSPERFAATMNVRSDGPLTEVAGRRLLALGAEPAALGVFDLPLDRADRRTDVYLKGSFEERLDLTIVLPEDATAAILPASMKAVSGDWGEIRQRVSQAGQAIRITRVVSLEHQRLTPAELSPVREAINRLRATGSRHLAYED
jgi:Domain of Unknown Function with PDB structure (DUF3857)